MRVQGLGGIPSDLMFIGEGPGKKESETGIPFHPDAPAGAELTRYLNGWSLPTREWVWITNLVKEWALGAKTKKLDVTPEDVARDEWELKIEIPMVNPTILCTLGRWSTRWALNADVDMEAVHGLLFRVMFCPDCGLRISALTDPNKGPYIHCGAVPSTTLYVLPCYHPAAGLHQPELAARTAYDLAQLAILLKIPQSQRASRCWTPSPPGHYVEGPTPSPVSFNDFAHAVGVDSEGYPGAVQRYSVSHTPGTGTVYTPSKNGGMLAPENTQWSWIFHNYPWDKRVFGSVGVEFDEDRFHDTMSMAYLLGVEPQALKDLALRHLGRVRKTYAETVGELQLQFSPKTGKPLKKPKLVLRSLDEIPKQEAIDYAGADADDTVSLKPILWKRIQDLGLESIYEIDRKVLPMYSRMEEVGMPIDLPHFAEFGGFLEEEIEAHTLAIKLQWPDLNPDNPDQVAALLFEHLGLPGGKKTKTGKRYSTEDKYLEAISSLHPIVSLIQDRRELQKVYGTFVKTLPQWVRPAADGSGLRLYFSLLATRVVTGRLAAKNPNVLALPKHSPLGKRFRAGFRAADGRLLGSWDFNQIELRVLALDSGSPTLLALYEKGADLHARSVEKIFGIPEMEQQGVAEGSPFNTPERRAAKVTNFSIPMGTTKVGLAEQQRKNSYPFPELKGQHFKDIKARRGAEEEVCDQWIKTVIDDWQIGDFISECHAEARRFGHVRCRWGRIRFLPSVLSPNKKVSEAAKREAQAFKPQAGARGYVKTFEARVWREVIKPLKAEGAYIEPILDIHDDLLLEFQEDLGPMLKPLLESIAESSFNEPIPILCRGSVGPVWSTL